MHYTPEQVGRMSLYQFAACVDGINDSSSSAVDPPTAEEFRAAKEAHGDI